jgi:diguanylate cyclase (GGDEF)-like protein/PAS domain S-box-containing protein
MRPMPAHRAAKPLTALLLLLLYYIAGRAGLALAYINTSASAVWAPTGIALAAMLVFGRRFWPSILLGAFLVNITTAGSLPASLLIAVGNTLEGMTGAWLVECYAGGRQTFDTVRNIVKFVLLGALAASMVSATVGVTALMLTGLANWAQYGPIWLTWWLGDASGAIIVTPALVQWAAHPAVNWSRSRLAEAAALLLALLLACTLIFSSYTSLNTPLAFLLLPLPVWAALRFGQREVALLCLLISGLAVAGTLHGHGPFARSAPNESLMLLQGFTAIITVTALILAAVESERKRMIDSLSISEERYRIVAEAASDAILAIDQDSRIVYANPAASQIFGFELDELLGSDLTMLMPELQRHRHREALARYIATGKRQRAWTGIEFTGMHREGRHLALEVSFGEYRQNGAHRFIGIVRDISVRKAAEQSQRLLAAIVESSDDAIIGKALDGTVLSWNRAAEQIYGFSADEMIGKPITRLIPEERSDEFAAILAAIVRGEHVRHHETERLRKDGSRVPISLTISPIRASNGAVVGASAISRDISERKTAEQRIHYLAQHDALTGLPNRMLCEDRIEQAITQAHRIGGQVAILFLDLDGFKHINDSLGHQVGDQVLQETAQRLQQCLRGGDSVARLGGDEFIITLPAISDGGDAMPVADKVLQALREPVRIGMHELHVSGSIGISLYPADGGDAATLMRAADSAMYHAKAMGRDHYQFFTTELNEAVQRHLQLANLLHQALERQELLLHYQPQVNLEDGRIVAAEALLRWQQPQLGLIEPSEFIKIAEDTGLIVPIGEWVLRTACQQLLRWRQSGHPHLCIAVNLSPQQVRYAGFVDTTRQVLEETWLPASALCIDITEALFMAQNPQSIAVLDQLAELGVRLAIDNFGSGYASLACLQRFPIHALKIDQAFIRGIGVNRNDSTIVKAIIAMAHSLRLRVIGEGVETVEQAAFLKANGCVDVQGFYCKEPLSEAAFDELLRVRAGTAPSQDSVS